MSNPTTGQIRHQSTLNQWNCKGIHTVITKLARILCMLTGSLKISLGCSQFYLFGIILHVPWYCCMLSRENEGREWISHIWPSINDIFSIIHALFSEWILIGQFWMMSCIISHELSMSKDRKLTENNYQRALSLSAVYNIFCTTFF